MGLLNKLFGGNKVKNEPDPGTVNLANEFTRAFNNYNLKKANELAEDMIEMAGRYWAKYDTASYLCLLRAAEETSFMYSGDKYPRDLVEELIRNNKMSSDN